MMNDNSARIAELTAEITALMVERDRKIKELQETTAQAVKALRAARNALKGRSPSNVKEWFGKTKGELTDAEITEYHRRKYALTHNSPAPKM